MILIDTHCHILKEDYNNVDEIIKKLERENVVIILSGYDLKSSIESLELANKYKNAFCTVGIHPLNVLNSKIEDVEHIEKLLINEKVVGIGEIGLDYHYPDTDKEVQTLFFERQLKLAEKHSKPIVIHSRDSIQDIYDMLSKFKNKGILHAYSGSLEMAERFIKLGYKLGIGGVVTFKNSNLKYTLKSLNIENIVLETDSPYLTPDPYRGKKNNPLYLKIIAAKISEIYNISIEEVAKITTQSSVDLFDLKAYK